MIYLALVPPAKWRAGFVGEKPFYFTCADCNDQEAPIAGVLASVADDGPIPPGLGLEKVSILTDPPRGPRHAMFCPACFEKRVTQAHAENP
jgi:hypothetical protein